jgi:hypothetical protein
VTETTTPLPEPGLQLARRSDLDPIARMGQWLAAAEAEQNDVKGRGMQAALRLAFARELGFPLYAAAEVHVIKGKLSLGATILRALAEEQGYEVKKVDASDTACTAVVSRDGKELGRSTFTIEQAQRRGLVKDRGGWVRMPERMLWARATTEALRDYAPKVMVGLVATEELDELIDNGAAAAPAAVPEPDAAQAYEDEQAWQEADAAPDEAGPGPWTDKQRRTIFAIIGDLDKRFTPPVIDGEQTPDWRDVTDRTVRRPPPDGFGKELRELNEVEADELIRRMRVRLETEEREQAERAAEAAREAEADAGTTTAAAEPGADDDIPF